MGCKNLAPAPLLEVIRAVCEVNAMLAEPEKEKIIHLSREPAPIGTALIAVCGAKGKVSKEPKTKSEMREAVNCPDCTMVLESIWGKEE